MHSQVQNVKEYLDEISKDRTPYFIKLKNSILKNILNRLDKGKSCRRFKKVDQIPYDLIAELMQKISTNDWVNTYQKKFIKH